VSSALYQRTHTGRGQFVDVAMLDAALAFIPGPVSEYTVAGIEQRQIGNGSVSRKPTAHRFRARDGYLVLGVLTEKQFASLMRAIGRRDALMDPRFKDRAARTEHAAHLREVIEGALASDDPKTWEARLTAADVPCASIWKIDEIVEHPQLAHRDVLQTIDSGYGPTAPGRRRLPARPREPGPRPPPAHPRGTHRRHPGRSRLLRHGDRGAAARRRCVGASGSRAGNPAGVVTRDDSRPVICIDCWRGGAIVRALASCRVGRSTS
jgi:crotonobetainyl-CoA:carnitine CoA-transferase CaiB-like acyl-CoA transferase